MRKISVGMTRIKHNHHLVKAEKGIGRRKGNYVCECGRRFTGVNHYEIHRADARKIEKEQESDIGLESRAFNPDYESAEEPPSEYFSRVMERDD